MKFPRSRGGAVFLVLAAGFHGTHASEEAPPAGSPSAGLPASAEGELRELRRRVEALEGRTPAQPSGEVDLTGGEVPYRAVEDGAQQTLAKPWYENFELWGFGAFDFLATGKDGARPDGGFMVRDASLFVRAWAWEDVSFYVDLQFTYSGAFYTTQFRTGELYAEVRRLFESEGRDLLTMRVGRLFIPFGEEYTTYRPPENPLITTSAGFSYGWDEGLLFTGELGRLEWAAAVLDGARDRGIDENWDKAVNVKVSRPFGRRLDLSASFMRTGETAESALMLASGGVTPVGAGGVLSTAGASTSEHVEAWLYQVDARYRLGRNASLSASFGQAYLDDRDSRFDRQLFWFSVEGLYSITPKVYAVARYSEVGTYRSSEGYALVGGFTAEGDEAFGFDARRLQRLALGLGWRPVPPVTLKVEVGCDRFEVIRGSPTRPENDARGLVGVELLVEF